MAPRGQMGIELFPAELETEAFMNAWADWLADRSERRLPRYTARAREKQLKRLAEMGQERAIAAIEWSITQGYKGIWEAPEKQTQAKGNALGSTKPSAWELQKQMELIEARIKQLKAKSPGDHCRLADFLSAEELAEYTRLLTRRKEVRNALIG